MTKWNHAFSYVDQPELSEYINQMGLDGWELVSAIEKEKRRSDCSIYPCFVLFFKRPIDG